MDDSLLCKNIVNDENLNPKQAEHRETSAVNGSSARRPSWRIKNSVFQQIEIIMQLLEQGSDK